MSKQRAKGTKWESAICAHLADEGIPHQRQPLRGVNDRGDIHVAGIAVVEAKNQSRHSLGEWLDEATAEAENAGRDIGAVWFHRRGRAHPRDGYVLLSGAHFTQLLREAMPAGAAEGDHATITPLTTGDAR